MNRKLYIFTACLFMFILSSGCSVDKRNPVFDNPVSYTDVTDTSWYGTYEYDDGDVIIYYIKGHKKNSMTIIFKSFIPYKNLDLYGSDEELYIDYVRKSADEKKDIILHVDGFYGQDGFYSKKTEDDSSYTFANSAIHITVNGKKLKEDNIHVFSGQQ